MKLRTFFGYILILITIPLLAFLVINLGEEWEKFSPFNQYLNKEIAIAEASLPEMSYITAGDGTVISEITNDERRILLSYEEIPQILKDAFVTVEDQTFFQHHGIDLIAIGRAIVVNTKNDGIEQGGSTITQQLARNLYLTHEKTYNRKLTELLYSYHLERNYTKEKILESYINAIFFGNGVYGIEAASQYYFNKSTKELTDAEILFLAAIPNNPSMYDPLKKFEETKLRQERIIDQLVQEQKITKEIGHQIKKEAISIKTKKRIDLYPDYVTYVEKELKQLIAEQEGLHLDLKSKNEGIREAAEKELEKKTRQLLESGVTIHTSLDQNIQKKAQASLQKNIPNTDVESSTVVIQHNTHELVSLTGAKDYKKYSFHRGFQSYRQPGSAIKPLLVYAPYLDMTGANIDQVIDSSPFCKNGYCPGNFGDGVYGNVSLKKAFSRSYNTPAVRTLDENGIKNSFAYLKLFEFKKIVEADYRLPSAIGGFTYGMSPLELTSAFSSFHDGTFVQPRAIRKITDGKGNILYQWKKKPVQVWKNNTNAKMRELLASVIQEGTGKKAAYPTTSYIGGKTGTTNDYHDLWFIGLNDTYTTGVWVGKDKPQSIEQLSSPHLYIWKEIMQQIK